MATKTYEYTAWDSHGCCREGVRQANSEDEVLSTLRDESLTPVSVRERLSESTQAVENHRSRTVKSADLAAFCWQLGIMISGGLPITTAMETIAEEIANPYFKHILKTMSERMQEGQSISQIASSFPKVFNKMSCAMLEAGETGGTMTTCLQRMATYYENKDKLTRKVKAALAYPIFVVVFIIGIVIALMTLIIPRFMVMFEQFQGKLPGFTLGFMAVYTFLMHNAVYILLAGAVVVVSLIIFSKTRRGIQFFSRAALNAPLFGPIKKMAFVAQFCYTLSTLLSSGVSVMDAFGILAGLSGNEILRNGVIQTRERIVEGLSISKSMESVGFFPGVAVKMTQIGEQSGSLVPVLEKTAEYYEKKVDGLVSLMTGLMEPILIVIVGAIVLVVVLAMYLPVFSIQV